MAAAPAVNPDPPGPASCSMCGATEAVPPITWVRDSDPRRGPAWICDRCARENLRGIEARLDQEWW